MNQQFNWIPFYEGLGNKLFEYNDNRKELFNIIKSLVPKHKNLEYLHFDRNDWWGERNYEIDPFSIFAMFNRNLKAETRMEIAKLLSDALGFNEALPTDFDGIPLMNNQNAFYGGVDEVWKLLEHAIACSKTGIFTEEFYAAFESSIKAKGNGLATITMGLFWIRPNTYLNLDKQNKSLLINNPALISVLNIFPDLKQNKVPKGSEYINMCKECQNLIETKNLEFKSLPELSFYACQNNEIFDSQDNSDTKLSNAAFLKWFAPLIEALKNLGNSATRKEVCTKIAENESLDENTLNETRGKNNVNKFDNEVAWARNYLVYAGIIDKSQRGIWKLTDYGKTVVMTDELASNILYKYRNNPTENIPEAIVSKKYWLFAPGQNASQWDDFYNSGIIGIGWDNLGDIAQYASKEDIKSTMRELSGENKSYKNDGLALWQFANDISVGDIIIAKQGYSMVLGRGVVESNYIFDESRNEYKHIRYVKWTNRGEFQHPGQAVQKALTDITQYTEYVQKLEQLFNLNVEIEIEDNESVNYEQYTKEHFLADVFMNEENYDTISNLIRRKKNLIIQGAPGVGKTYAANRLAYSLMGEKDINRVQLIQFHQSYSYEDFIMGYRPDKEGFKLIKGVFYEFCKKAQDDDENDYYFMIDEINRGNVSKIFGELFMLIEHDKRDKHNSMRLLYSNEQFYIPSNVHIIGMMNTADRSLAMIDYALRRRFAFFEMNPAFESVGFKAYQTKISNEKYNKLINQIQLLNTQIEQDETLGAGFRIGHSYFISDDIINDAWLKAVINYEILPLLQEYWFDEPTKVKDWADRLKGAIL